MKILARLAGRLGLIRQARLGGHFSGLAVDTTRIFGWVWDASRPSKSLDVELLMDGKPVAQARANVFRPDLLDAGKGNGKHGYSFPVQKAWRDGGDHAIQVRVRRSGAVFPNEPVTVRLEHTTILEGHFNGLSRDGTKLLGWIRDIANPDERLSVMLMLDGEEVAEAPADEYREDLEEAGKGDGRCAYYFPVKRAWRDDAEHVAQIIVKSETSAFPQEPRYVTLRKDARASFVQAESDSEFLLQLLSSGVVVPSALHDDANKDGMIGTRGKQKAIFVTHETTRTGAPFIILRLLEHFAQNTGLECLVFVERGGALLPDFAACGHLIQNHAGVEFFDEGHRTYRRILDTIAPPLPQFVLANTACVTKYLVAPQAQGIPVVTLVHEFLNHRSQEDLERLYAASGKLVFPAEFMRRAAEAYLPMESGKAVVVPQGLVHERFLSLDKTRLRVQAIDEMALREDAFVILACGTICLRKGVDRFIGIAIETLTRLSGDDRQRVHFVWMGAPTAATPRHFETLCQEDLNNANIQDHVHFVGETDTPEMYYGLADLALISSRSDPFPCVVHEAMAMRVPVLVFDNSGGAPEALTEGGGFVLPYHYTSAAAKKIIHLYHHPDECTHIGEQGRQAVQANYNFEHYYRRIRELLISELAVAMPAAGLHASPLDEGGSASLQCGRCLD